MPERRQRPVVAGQVCAATSLLGDVTGVGLGRVGPRAVGLRTRSRRKWRLDVAEPLSRERLVPACFDIDEKFWS